MPSTSRSSPLGPLNLPRPEPRERRVPEHLWGYVLVAPAVLLVLGLILYPVGYSFWLSLHSKHAYMPIETFIGLENFVWIWQDEDFWRSIRLGMVYAFGSLSLQIVVGVAVALLLNQTFVGRGFVRALALFPYMMPTIVVVILMRWIFNDSYGVAKFLLEGSGLMARAPVFFDPDHVMLTMILASTWTFFPFVVIGVLARLQTIDLELYAAAKVDGAGVLRQFWHVTLPQIRGVLFVIVLLRFMFMFTKFDLIWLFAGAGGLGYFVRTLPIYTFVKSFGELQVGFGAALSVIMFTMLSAFAAAYFRLFRRDEHA
ncbi:MAG: sugar ABC transporter permease [Alphaproteobacteria bacterium]|nr:sugar ABC transporter permease [Alphaproteobacteria bacterium]MBM3628848.1 sugar ABC transporter permease [Alphaproteobacteria bacterium]